MRIHAIFVLTVALVSNNFAHALSCDWEQRELDKNPTDIKLQAKLLRCQEFAAELVAKEAAARKAKLEENERLAEENRKKGGVRIGMTPNQVLASSWGKPKDVNRTTTAKGTREQWVYGEGNYLYFDHGKLTAIQD